MESSSSPANTEPNVLSRLLEMLSDQGETGKITRACDVCRKKKIRCDWTTPECGPCKKSKSSCLYSPSERGMKRRGRKALARTTRVEDRLSRIEVLLKSNMFKDGSQLSGLEILEQLLDRSKGLGSVEAPRSIVEDTMINSSFLLSSQRQIGMSCGVQLLEEYEKHPLGRSTSQSPFETTPTSKRTKIVPLPPLHEALPLIDLYFTQLNQTFPLFHQPSFTKLITTYYKPGIHTHYPAIWCAINVVLALGYRLLAISPLAKGVENEKGTQFLSNALSVAPDIVFYGHELLCVQALLGIAIILQGNNTPRSCSMLVAAACRLAHSIGLHRETNAESGFMKHEIEQRKRVFWIANILDKDISLRVGIPPLIDLDDSDVGLPVADDGVGFIYLNDGQQFNIFELRVRLSVIDGLVYKQLFSTMASKQPEEVRKSTVEYLDALLLDWRSGLQLLFEGQQAHQKLSGFDMIHSVVLYGAYFNTLMMTHRKPITENSGHQRGTYGTQTFDPFNFASHSSCVTAARELMILISSTPKGEYAYVWLILFTSLSALTTLLYHALHNPHLPTSIKDIEASNPLIDDILRVLADTGAQGNKVKEGDLIYDVHRMRAFAAELRKRAWGSVGSWIGQLDQLVPLDYSQSENGFDPQPNFLDQLPVIVSGDYEFLYAQQGEI